MLGFLLQSVPPEQLNMDTLSALKHLLHVVAIGGMLYKLLLCSVLLSLSSLTTYSTTLSLTHFTESSVM